MFVKLNDETFVRVGDIRRITVNRNEINSQEIFFINYELYDNTVTSGPFDTMKDVEKEIEKINKELEKRY